MSAEREVSGGQGPETPNNQGFVEGEFEDVEKEPADSGSDKTAEQTVDEGALSLAEKRRRKGLLGTATSRKMVKVEPPVINMDSQTDNPSKASIADIAAHALARLRGDAAEVGLTIGSYDKYYQLAKKLVPNFLKKAEESENPVEFIGGIVAKVKGYAEEGRLTTQQLETLISAENSQQEMDALIIRIAASPLNRVGVPARMVEIAERYFESRVAALTAKNYAETTKALAAIKPEEVEVALANYRSVMTALAEGAVEKQKQIDKAHDEKVRLEIERERLKKEKAQETEDARLEAVRKNVEENARIATETEKARAEARIEVRDKGARKLIDTAGYAGTKTKNGLFTENGLFASMAGVFDPISKRLTTPAVIGGSLGLITGLGGGALAAAGVADTLVGYEVLSSYSGPVGIFLIGASAIFCTGAGAFGAQKLFDLGNRMKDAYEQDGWDGVRELFMKRKEKVEEAGEEEPSGGEEEHFSPRPSSSAPVSAPAQSRRERFKDLFKRK